MLLNPLARGARTLLHSFSNEHSKTAFDPGIAWRSADRTRRSCSSGGYPERIATGHARRKAFAECAPAYVWRFERRGLFFGGRQAPDFSIDSRQPAVRSDLHHECRRNRSEDGLDRQGANDLQLHLPAQRQDSVFLYPPRECGLPAASGLFQGLCVGGVPGV